MVKIITGPINSGKSSWMRQHYDAHNNADGFVCGKVFLQNQHIGYDLQRLGSEQSMPFIRKTDCMPPAWNEAARTGKSYSFCHEGFAFASKIAAEAIANNCSCFYLDEIGPLELGGQGFYQLLQKLLASRMDLVIAVREHLLTDVIKCFAIPDPVIARPSF